MIIDNTPVLKLHNEKWILAGRKLGNTYESLVLRNHKFSHRITLEHTGWDIT